MKTGTDTYIQWKQKHYDQDVIRSYSSYICHTLARKNTQTNNISPFPAESPLVRIPPYPSVNFPPPSTLWGFGKVNAPLVFIKANAFLIFHNQYHQTLFLKLIFFYYLEHIYLLLGFFICLCHRSLLTNYSLKQIHHD